jgi:hypothetical protein
VEGLEVVGGFTLAKYKYQYVLNLYVMHVCATDACMLLCVPLHVSIVVNSI